MSDLVKRLSADAAWNSAPQVDLDLPVTAALEREAAAEIKRLTAERLVMLTQFETYRVRMAKIVALEAELKRVHELHTGLMKNADDKYDALNAELAAAKAKHYEECAVIAETTPHQYGVNADGRPWLAKATRNTCADAIRAALTDKPTQPLK